MNMLIGLLGYNHCLVCSHHHSFITHYITCYYTVQRKEIIRKNYMKNEVLKYMISIIVKQTKKLQIYLVGQP